MDRTGGNLENEKRYLQYTYPTKDYRNKNNKKTDEFLKRYFEKKDIQMCNKHMNFTDHNRKNIYIHND